MKIKTLLAAAGFAVAIAGVSPAYAQVGTPGGGMHPDDHQMQGNMPGGPMNNGGRMGPGDQGAMGGRGPGGPAMAGMHDMHDHDDMRGPGMRHGRHCHTVWHHHHRVRRCD